MYDMIRCGIGYDVHRLEKGRALVLGGVEIEHSAGLLGHSDADVLIHAVMDALIGAMAMGDIGGHFPDCDAKYKNISSVSMLEKVRSMLDLNNYSIGNIDATIIAQQPRLSPFIPKMRQNIADALGIDNQRVNIKATTTELLGFEGRSEGISAMCVCSIFKKG